MTLREATTEGVYESDVNAETDKHVYEIPFPLTVVVKKDVTVPAVLRERITEIALNEQQELEAKVSEAIGDIISYPVSINFDRDRFKDGLQEIEHGREEPKKVIEQD